MCGWWVVKCLGTLLSGFWLFWGSEMLSVVHAAVPLAAGVFTRQRWPPMPTAELENTTNDLNLTWLYKNLLRDWRHNVETFSSGLLLRTVSAANPLMVGCARFIDQKVYKLVTNFQTSLEQNIVSGAAPLWINNAPVHVSQTYPGLVWSPEPRYIHRGHVNQADTGSKMTIWVSWAYGHQIMRIRIRQKDSRS